MKASLNNLHHQGQDWLRELEFYKDELTVLTTRLQEITSRNTDKEVLAQVEHFQNKFIILREQLDTLKHDVGTRNHEIEALTKERPEHINEKFTTVHDALQERVKDFSRSLSDTRFEFNKFLSKYF